MQTLNRIMNHLAPSEAASINPDQKRDSRRNPTQKHSSIDNVHDVEELDPHTKFLILVEECDMNKPRIDTRESDTVFCESNTLNTKRKID